MQNPAQTPLAAKLAQRIKAGGPISLRDYMSACLYDPEFGYYRNVVAIGGAGDFITAPEISQIFGESIGLWAGAIWRQMGGPAKIHLVEFGPGRGTLMADAMRVLKVLPSFLSAVSVHLIETSKVFRDRQEAALQGFSSAIQWHESLETVPAGPSIVIANEFLDCFPIRQFIFDEGAAFWRERLVDIAGDGFAWGIGEAVSLPVELTLEPSDGSVLEYCPALAPLMRELAARSAEFPMAALFIDYGYDRQSFGETLQAVRSHRFADVFAAPGETDLTAHVNFDLLRRVAKAEGFSIFGPMPMGEWLLRLGLEARASQLLKAASPQEADAIKTGVARLVDPAKMGILFKAAAFTRGLSETPPPFQAVNKTELDA